MSTGSPFGSYAGAVALIAALAILGAWIASLIQVVPANPTLDAIALLVIGVIFGTGAGAAVVSNGAAHRADIANVRLDAVNAPQAATAQAMVTANGQSQADAGAMAREEREA